MADLLVHLVINLWEEKKCHFEAMEEGVFTLSPINITIPYLMKVCFTGKISSVEQPATWGKILTGKMIVKKEIKHLFNGSNVLALG